MLWRQRVYGGRERRAHAPPVAFAFLRQLVISRAFFLGDIPAPCEVPAIRLAVLPARTSGNVRILGHSRCSSRSGLRADAGRTDDELQVAPLEGQAQAASVERERGRRGRGRIEAYLDSSEGREGGAKLLTRNGLPVATMDDYRPLRGMLCTGERHE